MSFKYVLLLARQRSGTSALGSILNKSSEAYYLGEPFNLANFGKPKNFFSYKEAAVLEKPELMRPDRNKELWSSFLDKMNGKFGGKAFVDVKYNQTHHLNGDSYLPTNAPWLIAHAFGQKTPIIHLTRKNHLKNFVSVVRAKETGVWHTKTENQTLNRRVVIDIDELHKHIQRCQNTLSLFSSWMVNRGNVFSIDYSETFNGTGNLTKKAIDGIHRLTGYEGLEGLRAAFIKQTSDKLENEIENFTDVVAALAPTKNAWMLAE